MVDMVKKSQVGLASINDAADYLALSRNKVYQLAQSGDIPSKRFGRSVRIPWQWLHKNVACDDPAEMVTN